MLQKLQKRKESGFTIIEVLIVLAIAGLILLIVFLAVPALQRNARNTQRKNDTSSVASAVANFISNNGGSLPTGTAIDTNANTVDFCAAGGVNGAVTTGTCTASTNLETAKLGYYTPKNIWQDGTGTTAGSAGPFTTVAVGSESTTKVSTQSVIIDLGFACDQTAGTVKANSRTAAILYATESGSGNGSIQCVEQ